MLGEILRAMNYATVNMCGKEAVLCASVSSHMGGGWWG